MTFALTKENIMSKQRIEDIFEEKVTHLGMQEILMYHFEVKKYPQKSTCISSKNCSYRSNVNSVCVVYMNSVHAKREKSEPYTTNFFFVPTIT